MTTSPLYPYWQYCYLSIVAVIERWPLGCITSTLTLLLVTPHNCDPLLIERWPLHCITSTLTLLLVTPYCDPLLIERWPLHCITSTLTLLLVTPYCDPQLIERWPLHCITRTLTPYWDLPLLTVASWQLPHLTTRLAEPCGTCITCWHTRHCTNNVCPLPVPSPGFGE